MRKGTRNYVDEILSVWHAYFDVVHILAQLLWHSMNYSSRFASGSITPQFWVASMVYLLPSYHGKKNMSLGVFGCLEMVAIMPVGLVL